LLRDGRAQIALRFYGDAINDPKILKLPEVIRSRWIAVLAAASKNDGVREQSGWC